MTNEYVAWLGSFDEIEDNGKAAEAALEDLGRLSQRAQGLLHPILTEAFVIYRRAQGRKRERSLRMGLIFGGETSLDRRKERLESTFPLPDGRRVSWSEATEAEHLERIEMLQRHIAGVQETISEHNQAVALIRKHRVTCLSEIEEAA